MKKNTCCYVNKNCKKIWFDFIKVNDFCIGMKALNAQAIDPVEAKSKSSSSMSGYDSDLDVVEIELRKELIRLNNIRQKEL